MPAEEIKQEDSALLFAEIEEEESEDEIGNSDEEQDLIDAYNFSDDEFEANERMTDSNAFNQTNLMDGPHLDLEEIKETDNEESNEETF